MRILICRVAWMREYRSDDEEAIGDWPAKKGYESFERLNFLPVGVTYYGYVEIYGKNITLENLGGKATDESVTGVLVVFCAKKPGSREAGSSSSRDGTPTPRCTANRSRGLRTITNGG